MLSSVKLNWLSSWESARLYFPILICILISFFQIPISISISAFILWHVPVVFHPSIPSNAIASFFQQTIKVSSVMSNKKNCRVRSKMQHLKIWAPFQLPACFCILDCKDSECCSGCLLLVLLLALFNIYNLMAAMRRTSPNWIKHATIGRRQCPGC